MRMCRKTQIPARIKGERVGSRICSGQTCFPTPHICGCAGAVKRDRLKICWLSAYEGSNPFIRINLGKDSHPKGFPSGDDPIAIEPRILYPHDPNPGFDNLKVTRIPKGHKTSSRILSST